MDHQEFSLNLINSTYPATEGAEVVASVIDDKIQSLKRMAFSIEERKGLDTNHLKKRIAQLQEAKANFLEVAAGAKAKNYKLKINANISIEFVESKQEISL